MRMKVSIYKGILSAIVTLFMGGLLLSCNREAEKRLKYALDFAGQNRAELEMVLEHYQNDKMKYKAARFLIENMPAYYSYKGWRLDSLMKLKALSAHEDVEWIDSVGEVWKSYDYRSEEKVYDCHVMKADYLIDNIDRAFAVWEKRPWAKYYSFEDFCRWVLPYRIENEPLSKWRETYYDKYAPLLDSLYRGNDVVEATNSLGKMLNEDYFLYNTEFSLPRLGAAYLLEYHLGACRESCDYTVYILRSLGIPVDIDHYRISPEGRGGHSWNVLKDTTGLPVPFWFIETEVDRNWSDKRKKAKVYRMPYGSPVQDVTAEYFGKNKAVVEVHGEKEEVRLGVFCRGVYIPLDRAELSGGKAVFRNIEPEVRFVPVYNKNGVWTEAGFPFCVTTEGKTHSFVPKVNQTEKAILYRKYPPYWGLPKYFNRMAKARIEGSERTKDAFVPLGNLPDTITTNYYRVNLADAKVRYVRIVPPADENVEIGEIAFMNENGQSVAACKIEASEAMPYTSVGEMVDGDVLSYYASTEKNHPVIFDFGRIVHLSGLEFVPRNDDNFISVGDEYELFYHAGAEGWKSLGKQKAVERKIVYDNIPQNALLWLRDLTKGKEEQVFILKDGQQYFYR